MKILLKIPFIVFLLVSLANALVLYIPIEQMPDMADFVIMGTVIDSSSRWDEKGVMIYTDYTIQVEENISGVSSPQIVMSFAGGSVDGKTIFVTDTPVLEVGARYILFGYDAHKYSVPVVGHEQGVFRVVHDKVKEQDFVVDYNWYQLEITQEREVIRGPLTELDNIGALTIRKIEKKKKPEVTPKPVVRDVTGREIPQDSSVFAKPKVRKRGVPLRKSGFVNFIKKRLQAKEHIN